jgi:hypothetical protein
MGEHWAGPVNEAILCNSWQDFQKYFQGFNPNSIPTLANPYLAYAVSKFFQNGGTMCYIVRVMSSASPGASASATLVDGTATPQQTLKLTAGSLGVIGNPGTWGNGLFFAVTQTTTANRFNVAIYNGALNQANLVETWYDMSMNPTDSRYAPTVINSPTAGSLWVVATDLHDVDVLANAPAVSNGQFSGGADPADPTTQDKVNAITFGSSAFDVIPDVLNFALPGETTNAVVTAALQYSQGPAEGGTGRPFSFFVIDPPSGETPAAAVAYLEGLTPITSSAAMYSPWLVCTNPASPNLQSTILLPPSGCVLGQMVSTDTAQGPWRAPAGTGTVLGGVVQAERKLTQVDLGTLNNANVNALRTLPNGRVIIWGARTMAPGYSSLYVNVRRTLNYIEASINDMLQPFVFAPNDAVTWSNVTSSITQFLTGLAQNGAFATTNPTNAFVVTCNSSNNTPQSIAQGILNVSVQLALQYPIEFIVLTIAQIQGSGTTSISTSLPS